MHQPSCALARVFGICSALFGYGNALALSGSIPAIQTPLDSLHEIGQRQVLMLEKEPAIELCGNLVTHQDRVTVKPVARPPYFKAFKEPAFATRTMRISDSRAGQVNKPAGNPAQAWNSDESRLLLHRYGNQHELILHDGRTYQELGVLDISPVNPEDVFWSMRNPDLIYLVGASGTSEGVLIEYNIASQSATELKDFSPFCERQGLTAAGGQLARPSQDDDLFGFRCAPSGGKSLMLSYRHSNDQLNTSTIGKGSALPLDVVAQPFASGEAFWYAGQILDEQLQNTGTDFDLVDGTRKFSLGQTLEQKDALFHSPSLASPNDCNNDGWRGLGLVVEHRLADRYCRSVISQSDGYPQLARAAIFASAYKRPRWLAMSNNGVENLDSYLSRRQAPLLFSEVFIVNTTPDGQELCRLAHHRSYGSAAVNSRFEPSLGEPNVTQSPSGTRVLFSSDWYDSGLVDTYVIELPAYTSVDLNGRWVDIGNELFVTDFSQLGEKFSFERSFDKTSNPDSISTIGNGVITGSRLKVEYTILLGDDREVPGKCEGKVASAQDVVTLQCQDRYYGKASFTLKRQN